MNCVNEMEKITVIKNVLSFRNAIGFEQVDPIHEYHHILDKVSTLKFFFHVYSCRTMRCVIGLDWFIHTLGGSLTSASV